MTLADRLSPCGPVLDAKAAERAREHLPEAAEAVWSALAPVFAASPYLAGLARRRPDQLDLVLASEPAERLEALLARTLSAADAVLEDVPRLLREAKAEAHLLTALADLGGVWDLDEVTAALTRFADAALASAVKAAARAELDAGRLTQLGEGAEGPLPGWFAVAMGKHGAFELNYSSDIDISVFYEPDDLPLADGVEPQAFAVRFTQAVSTLMQERTVDGYVFRVDLRLRPDPSSTPHAVPVPAAVEYYETVGQNWERAAFIKARPCAGDIPRAEAFLEELQPFIWRRNLDFAAIADIHSIKRQIHAHKVDERLAAPGLDVKLGRGGIREIEFYVQTQQLILGGRHPELRGRRTLEALEALRAAGHVSDAAARDMTAGYHLLRDVEHRIQMIADEQTHRLPEAAGDRRRVAALCGYDRLPSFDAAVVRVLKAVNGRYGELFQDEEALSSKFGSLVFTGVEDDPETLATLKRMGFSSPAQVSQAIRGWHHGRINATRTERGRELFTQLAPRLLDAAQATGAPDTAFNRFADFFTGLTSGVQLQSLFIAQPALFGRLVELLAFAPQLARTLAQRPAAIDAMLDASFFDALEVKGVMTRAVADAEGFEGAMGIVRRVHREQAFRIGAQVLGGEASAEQAGGAFADLADLCIRALAPAALAEVERLGGAFEGEVAVIALGKAGSREMSAGSDLDLMTLYRASDPAAMSEIKGWGAETVYGRFTQRLVAALSAPTAEGTLYEVDLKLRPSGTKGPVAVSFAAFDDYYEAEAETWELLALTRARVVWSTSEAFAAEARRAIERALRRPHDPRKIARDTREMRELMERERPPSGFWDLKLSEGGLVDVEFAAQFLQLAHAGAGGPLIPHTAEALAALAAAGLGPAEPLRALEQAWRLQQDLTQVIKVALADGGDPDAEPAGFRRLLVRAGGARSWPTLRARLERARVAAREAYDIVVKA